MKRLLFFIAIVLLLIFIICIFHLKMGRSLEYDQIRKLEISETILSDSTIVKISGGFIDSGLAVSEIVERHYNGETNILVYLKPVSFVEPPLGYFQRTFKVTGEVKKITIGRERHAIWIKNNAGAIR